MNAFLGAISGGRLGTRRRTAGRTGWRPRPRTLAILAAVLLLLGGAWLWLRDSSLVAIKRVTITGVTGPDAGRIRAALRTAARNMTTLDVRMGELHNAVAPYPEVKDLRVSTDFPHGIRITIVDENPVAAVAVAGKEIPVAGDGTILHSAANTASLPKIPLTVPPGGSRLTDRAALSAVAVLAAAPPALLQHVSEVTTQAQHGVVAQLRNGPIIYFGDTSRLDAKWQAVTAVLADPGSAGAVYLDVTNPQRPAAGAPAPATGTPTTTGPSPGY